ncbi:DMT family transporter [Fusobacterium sp.]|uniref:DMT family transporter n=1 Tax=Fusobacterium sp. TaxID=68766 RepID=UPI00396C3726
MKKNTMFKGALFLVAIVWGGGFPITKIALDSGMAPNAIMAVRFLISSLLIFLFLFFKKAKMTKADAKLGLMAGVILGLAFSFQTVGLKYTTPSKNAFITGAYVVLVPFLLWLMTKKRPKAIVYISSLLCFIGIGLLSLDNGEIGMKYGDLLTLVSAVFFALQISVIGANIGDKDPLVINAFQMLSGGILTLILNICFENFSIVTVRMTGIQVAAVGFLIIFNTLFAYVVQTIAQKYVSSSTAALILSTEILFGALTSVIFMGEHITTRAILGGVLIFVAVLLSESDYNLDKILGK